MWRTGSMPFETCSYLKGSINFLCFLPACETFYLQVYYKCTIVFIVNDVLVKVFIWSLLFCFTWLSLFPCYTSLSFNSHLFRMDVSHCWIWTYSACVLWHVLYLSLVWMSLTEHVPQPVVTAMSIFVYQNGVCFPHWRWKTLSLIRRPFPGIPGIIIPCYLWEFRWLGQKWAPCSGFRKRVEEERKLLVGKC